MNADFHSGIDLADIDLLRETYRAIEENAKKYRDKGDPETAKAWDEKAVTVAEELAKRKGATHDHD